MNQEKKRSNVFIYFLATIVIVGLTFFFLEQSIITEVTPGYYFDPISLSNQMMLTGVILSFVSIFSFFIIRKIRLSFNGIFLTVIVGFVLLASLLNILALPRVQELNVRFMDGTYHLISLEVSKSMRATAVMTLLVNFSFIFFIVLVLPNHESFLRLVVFFTITMVIVAFVAIIYSFAVEWDKYVAILTEGPGNTYSTPFSFFNNRNPYASFLLSSQVMLFFLYYINLKKKRRFIYVFLQIPLIIAINFTYSKTNILLGNLLIILTLLHHFVCLLSKRKFGRFVVALVLSLLFVFAIIVFRYSPTLQTTKVSLVLTRLVPDKLFDVASRSFETRKKLWYYALSLMAASPTVFIFGHGPHLSRYFYHLRVQTEVEGVMTPGFGDYHNGLVEVMHTFGASGLIIYVLVFLFMIIMLIRRAKTNRSLTYFVLVSMGIFILRGQTESLAMLLFKSEGIISSLTFVLPALYLARLSHEQGFSKEINVKKTRPIEEA